MTQRADGRADAERRCPACGGVLLRERGSEGLCPTCLMGLALDLDAGGADIPGETGEPTLDRTPPHLAVTVGNVLGGRYRIVSELGRGGMGKVWRAVDLKLRVEVALKALRPDILADGRALDVLRHEVRSAREVVSPNVCRVFDLVELDGRELVSMEYVDGSTLLGILRERGPLDLSEARQIAAQLLAGLEAIHAAGLVHRDVKPENIMVTRSGRVVLMDFGIARSLAHTAVGTVSGTPAYMAPEQQRGEPPNPRADVFSAGMVLAEMVAPEGARTLEDRRRVWAGLHSDPPAVATTPWAPVIVQAVAHAPEGRFPSAAALSRALDEISLRVEPADDVQPYPGLAAFRVEDASYFYGRELEVEKMWKSLRRAHLLGLIGPSGAGKSSFVRAGLLAAMPERWRAVVTTPGSRPLANLVRALVPECAGDADVLRQLVDTTDNDSVARAVGRWRDRAAEALIVFDQFEELFTLNPPETQHRVADLIGALVVDADVRVLIAMRDDFLFHCAAQPALSPVFSELTPLRPPTGSALRRAVVQPALECGYRYEDDALVDDMIAEIADERGALPMLAFAAARLWECRDRDRGLITREAYKHIGGVGGALARHAERTLETLGPAAVPIVRELFRNLVTADGTRAARSRDELLSVFPPPSKRRDADADPVRILDALVDARLLTTYDVDPAGDGESPRQLVEIIHESLLASWPRLVRWQAQDQDGLLLRDQLRQAARLWEERGRPEDLLWTGTSFREYSLWRERYPGGLSADEEEFAHAMTVHAGRRRRRRRANRAAVVTALVIGLAVVASLWRQAERETRRSEANNLLAWGRLRVEDDPTAALAFALASLERTDTAEGRRLALEALWREPPARILEGTPRLEGSPMVLSHAVSVDFSPDGRWLAAGYYQRGLIRLWSSSGGEPVELQVADRNTVHVRFGPGAGVMTTRAYPDHSLQMWSVPELKLLRTLPIDGPLDFRMATDAERVFTFSRHDDGVRVESWSRDEVSPVEHPELAGRLYEWAKYANPWIPEVDPAGELIAYAPYGRGAAAHSVPPEVYVVGTAPGSLPRPVGAHPQPIGGLAFHPSGRLLASVDDTSEVRIWDTDASDSMPTRVLRHPPGLVRELRFDPHGSKLSAVSFSGHTSVWDLEGPPDAEPLYLHRDESSWSQAVAFDPTGRWHATSGNVHIAIRPITRRYATELLGHTEEVMDVAFMPDGEHLVSASKDGTVRLWSLAADDGAARVVYDGGVWLDSIDVDPSGRRCLVVTVTGSVWLVPLEGDRTPRHLGDFDTRDIQLALSDSLAVASGGHTNLEHAIRVWNLDTDEVRTYPTGSAPFSDTHLTPDNRLVTSGRDGIRVWDLEDGTASRVSASPSRLALTADGRLLLAGWQRDDDTAVLHDLETQTTLELNDRGRCEYGRLDVTGTIAATQPLDGFSIQVGRIDGGPLHLVADQHGLYEFELSPDARWIATVRLGSPNIELWPVPDLSRPPLHSLPHDQLLEKLRTLTNLRVVEHPEDPDLWAYELGPFPGWETIPEW